MPSGHMLSLKTQMILQLHTGSSRFTEYAKPVSLSDCVAGLLHKRQFFLCMLFIVNVPSDWRPGGHGFNPCRGPQHSFVDIDREIFLRPSQPNGVMSSAVSLPNHTFTGQA